MTAYSTIYHHDVLGDLTLACDGESVIGLWLEGQKYFEESVGEPLVRKDDVPVFDAARTWLDRYFVGDPLPVEALPLAPRGSDFRRRVWRILGEIPYGELRTYGDIADQVAREQGREKSSARAVGGAVGHNPISIILPCHRVVGTSKSLTGYAGGLDRKIWLLEHEGVDVGALVRPTRGTAL